VAGGLAVSAVHRQDRGEPDFGAIDAGEKSWGRDGISHHKSFAPFPRLQSHKTSSSHCFLQAK